MTIFRYYDYFVVTISDIFCIGFTPSIDLDLTDDDNETGGSDRKADRGTVISSQESFSEKVTTTNQRLGREERQEGLIPGKLA